MKNLVQNKKFYIYSFSILAFTSTIISFYLNINLSSINSYVGFNEYLLEYNINAKDGGATADIQTHWSYIRLLSENIRNLLSYELGVEEKILSYPLHHIIISQIPIVNSDLKIYLLFYFLFSLTLPILFYRCLILRFPNMNKDNLLGIASIIYILPAFQYSAIWGNPHITALFFLLTSIYFHLKLGQTKYIIDKYFFWSLVFLALAAYTKQYYVFLFPFILFIYFKNTSLLLFFKILLFCLIIALPGIFFLIKNPLLFTGLQSKHLDVTNFSSSVLIISSMVFFYTAPIFIQYFLNNFNKDNFVKIFNFKQITLVIFIFLLLNNSFYYNGSLGGGVIYKVSNIIFSTNLIFLICSFFGLFLILFYSKNSMSNWLLSLLLLISFSTGIFIFQKYLEPMLWILFFLFFDLKKIEESISKNNLIIILYFSIYYIGLNLYIEF
tara:strand:- start:1197 stop:2513 length:1317 start_codon:yes stop_codon:yes gene_type:complete